MEEIKAEPEQLFTIIIKEVKQNDYINVSPMPPENQISERLIKAVEASEESYRKGDFTTFKNTDELFEHLDNL